ncbi:MAG TPA: YhcH/YjgK/YiaL family protein [Longimicrobiaceae bacterium]|nr:YhcH/YjgK/YiaL family protein [Longimicrobiaceae bacterium]
MILDSLDGFDFDGLPRGVREAVDFLRGWDPGTPDGRHPVRGEEVFALVDTYDTGPSTERRFESHRAHLDVQYVAAGEERILHAPVRLLVPAGEYDPERDVVFYEEPKAASSLLLRAGDLAVLRPGDGHKPGCMAGGRHRVRKVVVKVKLRPGTIPRPAP